MERCRDHMRSLSEQGHELGHRTIHACQVYNLGQETFSTGDEQIDILNHFDKHYELPNSDNESIRKEAQTIAVQEPNIWNFNSQEDVKY